jgi:thiol peroxidase
MGASITMMGNPLPLEGQGVSVGQKAPDFTALANDLSPRTLADYAGKTLVLASVPSLDTPVCDTEVRRFNVETAAFGDKVQILALSCDLPFAQARWCGAAGIKAVQTLSDHRDTDFGKKYGVLISPLRLLARAIFIVNASGVITYAAIVPEATHEPDYAAALAAVRKAL